MKVVNILKSIIFVLLNVIFISSILYAQTASSGDGTIEIYNSLGVLGMGQTTSYIEADFSISDGYVSTQEQAQDMDIGSSFFEFVDFTTTQAVPLLTWKDSSSKYMIKVYPEKVKFELLYSDAHRDTVAITAGYPKVSFNKIENFSNTQSLRDPTSVSLNKKSEEATCWVYEKDVSIEPGIYQYQYSTTNESYPSIYTLETASFVVTQVPGDLTNTGIQDKAIVSNAKVNLKWEVPAQAGTVYTYRLYLWEEGDTRTKIYEGSDPFYEVTSLKYSTKYYWEVETINQFGAVSSSQRYEFTTIKAVEKPFNYPNPFNPNKETTSIVFHVDRIQEVEIKIYSEYADLIYHTTVSAAVGANEFIYDGKDDRGKTLYNGSYICRVKTDSGEKTCYLLIIK